MSSRALQGDAREETNVFSITSSRTQRISLLSLSLSRARALERARALHRANTRTVFPTTSRAPPAPRVRADSAPLTASRAWTWCPNKKRRALTPHSRARGDLDDDGGGGRRVGGDVCHDARVGVARGEHERVRGGACERACDASAAHAPATDSTTVRRRARRRRR